MNRHFGKLKRDITFFQLVLLSLGGIIGAGIFLASSITIKTAGPGVVITYLAGGLIMTLVVSALAEMASTEPGEGGFSLYASYTLGPYMGFITGWMYWTSGCFTMASEVTAAAVLAKWWFPNLPLWVFTILFSLLLTAVNSLDVKGFGKLEAALAAVKVFALAAFIVTGGTVLLGLIPGRPSPGINNYLRDGFLPHGLKGATASLLLVMFSYAGTSVIAMAAAETKNPAHIIPRAIKVIIALTIFLYVGTVVVISGLVPWDELSKSSSPLTQTLSSLRIPYAAGIINFIILTAVLSSMNAAMYGVSRMLHALSQRGEAPLLFTRLSPKGVPLYAVMASSLLLFLLALVSYFLPRNVFIYVTSTSGFVSMFNWLVISIAHLRFRPLKNRKGLPFPYQAWGYPYTSLLAAMALIAILSTAYLLPEQRPSLVSGLLLLALYTTVYLLRRVRRGSQK